jgi:hypothetical protein
MEPEPLASAPRRVEAYLDQILAPLARRLPPFHQEELRRELREHLWSRVDAYRELGMAEEESVTEALRQFGGGKDFLRQWQREWTQTPPQVTPGEIWEAARPAFCLSALALSLACLPALFTIYQMHRYGTGSWVFSNGEMFNHMCQSFLLLFLPIMLGLTAGKYIPCRAAWGVFAALSLDMGLGAALSGIGGWMPPKAQFFSNTAGLITLLAAPWIPVACASAALSSRWLRRSKARRLA